VNARQRRRAWRSKRKQVQRERALAGRPNACKPCEGTGAVPSPAGPDFRDVCYDCFGSGVKP
jgi:DnaJ-class molecular chaperone